jgi:dihydrofolate synthase/folylpolyglutamate synthase
MADKDLDSIIPLMPRKAKYIFVAPDTPRALSAEAILRKVRDFSTSLEMTEGSLEMTEGAPAMSEMKTAPSVKAGIKMAMDEATDDTVIYIGGSTFVVAEAL